MWKVAIVGIMAVGLMACAADNDDVVVSLTKMEAQLTTANAAQTNMTEQLSEIEAKLVASEASRELLQRQIAGIESQLEYMHVLWADLEDSLTETSITVDDIMGLFLGLAAMGESESYTYEYEDEYYEEYYEDEYYEDEYLEPEPADTPTPQPLD